MTKFLVFALGAIVAAAIIVWLSWRVLKSFVADIVEELLNLW